MMYALLILVSLQAAAFGEAPYTQPVSAPQSGEYYSSGGFKANRNAPATRAALGGFETDHQASQKFEYEAVKQGTGAILPGEDPADKAIRQSKLNENLAPQARAKVVAAKNGLGWDEKLYDTKRVSEIGALGMDVEDNNLGGGYAYAMGIGATNQIAQKEIEAKLDFYRNGRRDQASAFRETAAWATRGLNKMTRDSYLDDVKAPEVAANPSSNGTPLGPNNFKQQQAYDRKVDRVVDNLSSHTLDFLRENGISARDYAEAYVDGDFNSGEGREDFFSRYGNLNGTGGGGAKALSESAKEYVEQLNELLDGLPDPEDSDSPVGRGRGLASGQKVLPPETIVMNDTAQGRFNSEEETEKRALLSFVEDWWNHTTGKKVDPTVVKRGVTGPGQKLSPLGPERSERRRTIFDIAGETYRRGSQS